MHARARSPTRPRREGWSGEARADPPPRHERARPRCSASGCDERGHPYVVALAGTATLPDPRDFAFDRSLGSKLNPRDTDEPQVVRSSS
jgi:hypothetical protein